MLYFVLCTLSLCTFQKVLDNLPPIALLAVADVHPMHALLVVLPDKLIKVEIALDVVEYTLALRYVATDVDVRCLACHVLRIADTSDCPVQGWTTVAARYGDGFLQS